MPTTSSKESTIAQVEYNTGVYVIFNTVNRKLYIGSAAGKYGIKGGVERSADYRAKQSVSQTGKKLSDETRAKISAVHKGRKHTKEHVDKISIAQRGRKFSDEHRTKLSIAAKLRWSKRYK